MTDKQIIIDGVDVSECPAMCTYNIFSIEDKPCCYKFHEYCSVIPNCCFKQPKREEKECNKLKQTITEIKEIAENWKRFAERCMITGEHKTNVLTYANAILRKINECDVENKYNTKDIRHINEKNQEYIAEGNRMTK